MTPEDIQKYEVEKIRDCYRNCKLLSNCMKAHDGTADTCTLIRGERE